MELLHKYSASSLILGRYQTEEGIVGESRAGEFVAVKTRRIESSTGELGGVLTCGTLARQRTHPHVSYGRWSRTPQHRLGHDNGRGRSAQHHSEHNRLEADMTFSNDRFALNEPKSRLHIMPHFIASYQPSPQHASHTPASHRRSTRHPAHQ